MNTRKCFFGICLIFIFAISACNLNIQQPGGGDVNVQAATIVALTLQASSGSPATPVSLLTQTGSATITVTDNTNCRSGPGTNYAKITVIPANTKVQIIAQSVDGDYWVVSPADGSGNCWIRSDLGTVAGDTAPLPQFTPSAGGGGDGTPARPGSLFYSYTCPFGELTTHLTWSDSADNENGYRVYRFNILLDELPANSTEYTDQQTVDIGTALTYSVEAFNENGASPSRSVSFKCE